jgi:hypothetical protein
MDCERFGKCSWTVGGELESYYMGRLAFATRWNSCSLILLNLRTSCALPTSFRTGGI